MIQILFAILAGILTVGAPCILPVLPIVLGTSIAQQSKTRPLFIALGFIISFAALSLLFAAFTHVLGLSQSNLRIVGMVLLFIFGLLLIFPGWFERLTLYLGPAINKISTMQGQYSGNFGGFVIGLTIGIVWTPCAGPVLGTILTLIATTKDWVTSGILLTFYALGAGIPMVVLAYGGQYFTTKVRAFAKYARTAQVIFGFLIIALAVAIYFNYDVIITAKISSLFPSIATPKY